MNEASMRPYFSGHTIYSPKQFTVYSEYTDMCGWPFKKQTNKKRGDAKGCKLYPQTLCSDPLLGSSLVANWSTIKFKQAVYMFYLGLHQLLMHFFLQGILRRSSVICQIPCIVIVEVYQYLYSWRGSVFPCGSGGHHGSGLNEGCGHLWRHGCGPGWGCHTGHITYQPHTAVNLDVRVTLSSHVQHLEAIIVKARELTLKGPATITTTNCDCCLSVENC